MFFSVNTFFPSTCATRPELSSNISTMIYIDNNRQEGSGFLLTGNVQSDIFHTTHSIIFYYIHFYFFIKRIKRKEKNDINREQWTNA